MWDGLLTLLLLCLVMGAASFLAGLLPLTIALSQRQLRLITALGTGVLVGTSLIVIIPEGIETLYSASGGGHGHAERGLSTGVLRRGVDSVPAVEVRWDAVQSRDIIALPVSADIRRDEHPSFRTGPDDGFNAADQLAKGEHPSSDHGHEEGQSLKLQQETADPSHPKEITEHTHSHDRNPHAYVGISLITGFILMYLIDTLPRRRSASQTPKRTQINLNTFSLSRGSQPDDTGDAAQTSGPSHRPSSTTVGLVIHAAADGIALGASSTSTSGLNFIIFIALMIHKAPAAFGLTTVLLKQGLSKRAARAHLIVFSAAAPAGALLTWATAHLLGYGSFSEKGEGTEFATGVLLLFSAGTFLYVAMHTMQETGTGEHGEGSAESNGYVEMPGYEQAGPAAAQWEEGGMMDSFMCVAGMLLPLLTQFGHVH